MPGPTVGQVIDGYRFKGGNPNDRGAWEPVAAAPGAAAVPAGLTRLADGSLMTGAGPRGGAPKRVAGLSVQEQVQLGTLRSRAGAQRTDLADSERFARLMENQGTGGILSVPFAGSVVGAFDDDVDEMREINARLTPAQRTPGAGATSDADLRLYQTAVPGVARRPSTNEAIINRGRARAGESQRQSEFYDWYASQNGTLQGALQAWNNIYDPPPVAAGTTEPRANVRPTAAQRATVNRLNQSGARNNNAVLGTRQNPRVPPEGYNIESLPAGDWYVTPSGQVAQVAREQGNRNLRARSGRSAVVGVRRVQ